jgi:hypothetical protein
MTILNFLNCLVLRRPRGDGHDVGLGEAEEALAAEAGLVEAAERGALVDRGLDVTSA